MFHINRVRNLPASPDLHITSFPVHKYKSRLNPYCDNSGSYYFDVLNRIAESWSQYTQISGGEALKPLTLVKHFQIMVSIFLYHLNDLIINQINLPPHTIKSISWTSFITKCPWLWLSISKWWSNPFTRAHCKCVYSLNLSITLMFFLSIRVLVRDIVYIIYW